MEGGRANWFAPLWAPECRQHPEWRRAAETDILRHDLYFTGPSLRTFVRGRVALVGDAAHAVTPDLGQGACRALVDGATLGDWLAKHRREEAFSRYDLLRRKPFQGVARAARQAGLPTMRPGPAAVRDGLLRAGAFLLR
ncbi:FAD-dependent monooxygenase [Actinocrispum sp. NPDC049592]|uniref:FAD-dependent monooxygenase n=1 Tax=Actinocrispum sp. NPDC049592 TaxID=3154835 RepID=UPI00343AEFC3